jgi:hypothetical protein
MQSIYPDHANACIGSGRGHLDPYKRGACGDKSLFSKVVKIRPLNLASPPSCFALDFERRDSNAAPIAA